MPSVRYRDDADAAVESYAGMDMPRCQAHGHCPGGDPVECLERVG
jgi:hypothetical protein